jgi:hypothetical protein
MKDSASRAQHYYDLALEFLAMTRFATAVNVRERYRMMGQHYLTLAGAELARSKSDSRRPGAEKDPSVTTMPGTTAASV